MLPEVLSNGLCSLNPQVDRLCMVCDMQLSPRGVLKDFRFYPAVMFSHARLTYTKVAAMLVEGDAELRETYREVLPHLEDLHALYKVLRKRREQRGAIDFETVETRIVPPTWPPPVFCSRRRSRPCTGCTRDRRRRSWRICVAKLLKEVQGRPDAHLIQTVLLRSLKQAVYSPDNVGHFGLAYDAYAHFTSPIRRYPDLLVHRAIRHVLSGQPPELFRYDHEKMVNLGEHCSQTERRADEATRDVVDWLKCEYMLDEVGGEFDGTITSVTGFGLFVELDDIYVEGLIHITSLENDYYHFDPVKHQLVGEHNHQVYRLGDRLRVKVARVDLDERKIDFAYVGPALSQPTTMSAAPESTGGKKGTKKKAAKKKAARKTARKTHNRKKTRRSQSKAR